MTRQKEKPLLYYLLMNFKSLWFEQTLWERKKVRTRTCNRLHVVRICSLLTTLWERKKVRTRTCNKLHVVRICSLLAVYMTHTVRQHITRLQWQITRLWSQITNHGHRSTTCSASSAPHSAPTPQSRMWAPTLRVPSSVKNPSLPSKVSAYHLSLTYHTHLTFGRQRIMLAQCKLPTWNMRADSFFCTVGTMLSTYLKYEGRHFLGRNPPVRSPFMFTAVNTALSESQHWKNRALS